MDSLYIVTIPGVMRGKQRPRMSTRGGFARAYTPEQTVNAEAWVKQCCVDQVGAPCLLGPLEVRVSISVGIPASWSKKRRQAALDGREMPTGKPDVDNSVKLLADALNGVLWKDDAQIVSLSVRKSYAEAPLTVLTAELA
jgi:Holliday junction resolvase RusA-like endonuclease